MPAPTSPVPVESATLPCTTAVAGVSTALAVAFDWPAASVICCVCGRKPSPAMVTVYRPGAGSAGRVYRPTGPLVTVVAVRVMVPSVTVTLAPPRPPLVPRLSVPCTVPTSEPIPDFRFRFTDRAAPAPRVTIADSRLRPSLLALTRKVPGVDSPPTVQSPMPPVEFELVATVF